MKIPEEFYDVAFGKSVAFGYRTEDVDEFVTNALQIIKSLEEENKALQEKMGVLGGSLEKYREDEDSLRSALIGAQKLGDSILKDSRSKAEIIIRDATTKADRIVEDAHRRLEMESTELDRIKLEVSQFKDSLIALYKNHLDLIKRLPSMESAKKEDTSSSNMPTQESTSEKSQAAPDDKVSKEEKAQSVSSSEEKSSETASVHIDLNQLTQEEQASEDMEEDISVISFRKKMDKIMARTAHNQEDSQEENDTDSNKKAIVSPKYGVLKFGDGFSLEED